MERRNREKACLLYDFIDNSTLYSNPVRKEDRSVMNVVFRLPDDQLTSDFISVAASKGLINLKGHRANGGCRASLYNGMPLEGVKKLIFQCPWYDGDDYAGFMELSMVLPEVIPNRVRKPRG